MFGDSMNESIKGNVKKIIYQGDNGYTVGLFRIKDATKKFESHKDQTVSFTGYFHELNESDTYQFYGDFIIHAKYGEQFQVELYDRCMPEEKDSMIEFLSSGLFKGIGEKTAEKIVTVLGKDTISIILQHPDNLLLIPGITKKQIDTLHLALLDYESSYRIILMLNEIGFATRESMIIYHYYKGTTPEIIGKNLYQLIEDLKEINFRRIDAIALKQGYLRDDKRRIKASILYVMEELCNLLGHCYLYLEEIYQNVMKVLVYPLEYSFFEQMIDSLIEERKIRNEKEKYYTEAMWNAEENIVKRMKFLLNQEDTKVKKLDQSIATLQEQNEIIYNEDQLRAIHDAMIKNTLIISGGPGTGKTTIIKAITQLYQKVYQLSYDQLIKDLVLLAPTGRASKRLSESTLLPSSTIHSFLKWNKDSNKFAMNEYHKSTAKIVIIDEASMIDVLLFDSLLKGLKVDTKIILVGDYNQLPSVGPGQLLKDLMESEVFHTVRLEQLYRQKKNSNIVTLAYEINQEDIHDKLFSNGEDLEFYEAKENVLSAIEKICKKDSNTKEYQVLAPMYKTINGIDSMNQLLQSIYNPKSKDKKEIEIGKVIYREQDKVLQLVNMPDEKIFNGDIGTIIKIDKKEIEIDFDGNIVKFTPSNYFNFKHGYAISIHKSQGSEFNTVILPVVKGYSKMLYKKLYYTAVTRAKKKLIIVGDLDALKMASKNNHSDIRKTSICEKLQKKMLFQES